MLTVAFLCVRIKPKLLLFEKNYFCHLKKNSDTLYRELNYKKSDKHILFSLQDPIHPTCRRIHVAIGLKTKKIIQIKTNSFFVIKSIYRHELACSLSII